MLPVLLLSRPSRCITRRTRANRCPVGPTSGAGGFHVNLSLLPGRSTNSQDSVSEHSVIANSKGLDGTGIPSASSANGANLF